MKNFPGFLISSLFFLNICLPSIAQPGTKPGYVFELYQSVINEFGFDQVLVNGISYQEDYHEKLGHPFFLNDQLYKGTLVFRGRVYRDVDLKYDIYNQQVILYVAQNHSTTWLIPPNDFITSFSLGDKSFARYTFNGVADFYQVILDNKDLKCLYHWSKLRYDSDHKQGYNAYRFTNSERKSCIVMNGGLNQFRNNRSFVRLFPRETRLQINQYLKKGRIKVAGSSDAEMKGLMIYCETLLELQ